MSEETKDTVENDTSGQPAEEMQSEINDLIDGMISDENTSEDEEADKIIDGLDESAEEDTEDEPEEESDEQEDTKGEDEDSEESTGEEESDEESERGSEEDSEKEGAKEGEEKPESDPVDLEAQNKMLMGLISTMQNPPVAKPLVETDKDETPESEPEKPKTEPLGTFLGDHDIDEVMGNPKVFNTLMQDHDSRLINATVQQVLLAIPKVIDSQVKNQNVINSAVNDFYRENKDLVAFKPLVGAAANQVQAEEPTWTMVKVLDEAATRTRKAMGLSKQAVSQDDPTPRKSPRRKPGLPSKKPGARTPTSSQSKVSKLEKEIMDLA